MAFLGSGKIKTKNILTDEQNATLTALNRQVFGEIGKGSAVYPDQIVPGATGAQTQVFEQVNRGFDRTERDAGQDQAIMDLLSGDPSFDVDPTARRELYEAERSEELRRFQEEILPMLSRAYGARGAARSGGLERSMRLGSERLGEDLYRRNTELLYADEGARRQELSRSRDRQAVGVEADIMGRQGQYGELGARFGLGAQERGIQGEANSEAYNKWLSGQPYYNPWLGYLPSALGTKAKAAAGVQKEGSGGIILGAI